MQIIQYRYGLFTQQQHGYNINRWHDCVNRRRTSWADLEQPQLWGVNYCSMWMCGWLYNVCLMAAVHIGGGMGSCFIEAPGGVDVLQCRICWADYSLCIEHKMLECLPVHCRTAGIPCCGMQYVKMVSMEQQYKVTSISCSSPATHFIMLVRGFPLKLRSRCERFSKLTWLSVTWLRETSLWRSLFISLLSTMTVQDHMFITLTMMAEVLVLNLLDRWTKFGMFEISLVLIL